MKNPNEKIIIIINLCYQHKIKRGIIYKVTRRVQMRNHIQSDEKSTNDTGGTNLQQSSSVRHKFCLSVRKCSSLNNFSHTLLKNYSLVSDTLDIESI